MSRILIKSCRASGLPWMLSLPKHFSHILRQGCPATSRFSGDFMRIWRQRWLQNTSTLENSYHLSWRGGCGGVYRRTLWKREVFLLQDCSDDPGSQSAWLRYHQRQWIIRDQSCKQEAWASLRSVDSAITVSSCVILDKWHNPSWVSFSISLSPCLIQLAMQKSQKEQLAERDGSDDFFFKARQCQGFASSLWWWLHPSFNPCSLSYISVLVSPLVQLQWPSGCLPYLRKPSSECAEGRGTQLCLCFPYTSLLTDCSFAPNHYHQTTHWHPGAPLCSQAWKSYEPSWKKKIPSHISKNGCLPSYQCKRLLSMNSKNTIEEVKMYTEVSWSCPVPPGQHPFL